MIFNRRRTSTIAIVKPSSNLLVREYWQFLMLANFTVRFELGDVTIDLPRLGSNGKEVFWPLEPGDDRTPIGRIVERSHLSRFGVDFDAAKLAEYLKMRIRELEATEDGES